MSNDLVDEKFVSREAWENRPSWFFANRDKGFYRSSIMKVPSKKQQNCAYLTYSDQTNYAH